MYTHFQEKENVHTQHGSRKKRRTTRAFIRSPDFIIYIIITLLCLRKRQPVGRLLFPNNAHSTITRVTYLLLRYRPRMITVQRRTFRCRLGDLFPLSAPIIHFPARLWHRLLIKIGPRVEGEVLACLIGLIISYECTKELGICS